MGEVIVVASILIKIAIFIEYFMYQAQYSWNAFSHLMFTAIVIGREVLPSRLFWRYENWGSKQLHSRNLNPNPYRDQHSDQGQAQTTISNKHSIASSFCHLEQDIQVFHFSDIFLYNMRAEKEVNTDLLYSRQLSE